MSVDIVFQNTEYIYMNAESGFIVLQLGVYYIRPLWDCWDFLAYRLPFIKEQYNMLSYSTV